MQGLAGTGVTATIGRTTETFYTVWFRFNGSLPSGNVRFLGVNDTGSNVVVRISTTSGGAVTINGATSSATVATIVADTWYRADFRVTSNGTSGLKINGGTEQTCTAGNFTQGRLIIGRQVTSEAVAFDCNYDDWWISDSAFAPDDGGVRMLKPTAVNTNTWTGGTGSGASEVDDLPAATVDADTTYVGATATDDNKTQNYTMTTSSAAGISGHTVTIVKSGTHCRTDSTAGTSAIFPVEWVVNGGTLSTTSLEITTSYLGYYALAATANGSAWTTTLLDGLKVGAHTGTIAQAQRMTALLAMVWSVAGDISIDAGTAAATGAGVGATVLAEVPGATGAGTAAASGSSALLSVTTATGTATGAGAGATIALDLTGGTSSATAAGVTSTIGLTSETAAATGAGNGASALLDVTSATGTATGAGVGATMEIAVGAGTASGTGSGTGGSETVEVTTATATATAAADAADVTITGGDVSLTAGTAAATGAGVGPTVELAVPGATGTGTAAAAGADSTLAVTSATGAATGAGVGATLLLEVGTGTGASTAAGNGSTSTIAVGAGTASGTGAGAGGSDTVEVTSSTATATAAADGATVTAGSNVDVNAETATATGAGVGATLLLEVPGSTGSGTAAGNGSSSTIAVGAGTASGTGAGAGSSDTVAVGAATATATAAADAATVMAGGNINVDAGTAVATAAAYGADITNTTIITVFGLGGGVSHATPYRPPEYRRPPTSPITIEAGTAVAYAYGHGVMLFGSFDEMQMRRILAEDEELLMAGVL